jgi:hypothetical protein
LPNASHPRDRGVRNPGVCATAGPERLRAAVRAAALGDQAEERREEEEAERAMAAAHTQAVNEPGIASRRRF